MSKAVFNADGMAGNSLSEAEATELAYLLDKLRD